MDTVLVSIISDQTIPNLLIIKEFNKLYSSQIFISTKKMEEIGKSAWIEKAAGIEPGTIKRIIVDENDWDGIIKELQRTDWRQETGFLVNLTGGTKIMTLSVFEYFAKQGNQIIYVSIRENGYQELYPDKNNFSTPFETRLNLEEYFGAYGISFTQKSEFIKSYSEIKKILKSYKNKGYDIENLHKGYPAEWKNYFTGEWFEEYLYFFIKNELQLSDEHIATNIELNHSAIPVSSKNDLELDIAFTLNNELYIVEAKVSIGRKKLNKELLSKILFKLSAINKNFGLRSHSFVFTMANINEPPAEFETDLQRKMRVLGIRKIIHRDDFNQPNFSIGNIF